MVRALLTNPLDQDPVLKDLLKKLDLIETRRGFARWKKHFLEQFELHLDGVSITKAGQKYHAFARRLDRLVLLLKALERLMSSGDLSATKVTVKSRQSLAELQKQLTGMIEHTQALVPGTLEQENTVGYTKFDMGMVLVKDGFVEYDRLCLCRDVLWHMRDALLQEVADRQLLEEMERYELHLQAFCGIMGTDLGLQRAMLKCRDILRAEDDEFYQYQDDRGVVRTVMNTSRRSSKSADNYSEYDDEQVWDDQDDQEEIERRTSTHRRHARPSQQQPPRAPLARRREEQEEEDDYEDEDDDDDEEDDDEEEEEEEEEDDDDSSDYSDVVEIYGMEIPLRLTRMDSNNSLMSDDVSELSFDSNWSWSLQVPAAPRKIVKTVAKPAPGSMPTAPTLDLDDDDDDDNDEKGRGGHAMIDEEATYGESSVIRHDSTRGSRQRGQPGRKLYDDDDDEEETQFDPPSVPPKSSGSPSVVSSLTDSPSRKQRAKSEPITKANLPPPESSRRKERQMSSTYVPAPSRQHPVESVNMPPRTPPQVIPDHKPTQKMSWTMNDYYHGNAADWKNTTMQAKERHKSLNTAREEDDEDDASDDDEEEEERVNDNTSEESSPSKKKVVLKARLRKKTTESSDEGDNTSNDGIGTTGSLDINDERVVIRRRGRKKPPVNNDSSHTEGTNPSEHSRPRSVEVLNDSGSDVSSRGSRSSSGLDNARHRRKKKGMRRGSSVSSRGSKKSTELRRMAKRAAAMRRREDGGDDTASTDSKRSMGSRRSNASSRRSGKKDPLHNLLFKKTPSNSSIVVPNNANDNDSTGADHTNGSGPEANVDLVPPVSPLSSPVASPVKGSRPRLPFPPINDEEKQRTRLCYTWYGRLGHPNRETFRERVRTSDNSMDGLQVKDVDLLPWIHGGARINVSEMTRLLSSASS